MRPNSAVEHGTVCVDVHHGCTLQVGTPQVSIFQIDVHELGIAKIRASQVGTGQIDVGESTARQGCVGEVAVGQVAVDIGLAGGAACGSGIDGRRCMGDGGVPGGYQDGAALHNPALP